MRKPNQLISDLADRVRRKIRDQVILITGGAGTIGTALAERLVQYEPRTLRLLDNNEEKAFYLNLRLGKYEYVRVFLGDVRDRGCEHGGRAGVLDDRVGRPGHVLRRERFEKEMIAIVVIGRDSLRIGVYHDRLIAGVAKAERGLAAAVVKLDPLADPIRPTAEDHDAGLAARGLSFVFGISHR